MSEFASNKGTASQHSSALKSPSGGSSSSITYANETNLTVISNSKDKGTIISKQIEAYKELLAGDADRIGSLGEEFESLDSKIAAEVEKQF